MNVGAAWGVVSAIGKATWEGIKLLQKIRRRVDTIPPTQPDSVPPLTFRDVEHQRAQAAAATSHKVKR